MQRRLDEVGEEGRVRGRDRAREEGAIFPQFFMRRARGGYVPLRRKHCRVHDPVRMQHLHNSYT